MRCFIAINLDDVVKKEIDASVALLKKEKADVKWVPAANLHVTLKFFGEIDERTVEKIEENLSEISRKFSPFEVKLHGLGVFPDERRPRVIWIDFLDSRRLIKLQEEVEYSIVSIGFEKEDRPFSPHLTIGRVRSPKNKDLLLRAMGPLRSKDFGNIGVDKIFLMKSDLKPTGAQYTAVAEFPLTKEEQ